MPQQSSSLVFLGAVVGGYRLVRKLGDGREAPVFLGYSEAAGGVATAAIKIYTSSQQARAHTEIEALSRAPHRHVLTLFDVASAPEGGVALLLERLELGSLAQMLAHRASVSPGEAVTLLAPIATAIDALHEAGVGHGAISPRCILFRSDGAPVLVGLGSAVLYDPGLTPARLALEAVVSADRAALCALARTVLTRVGDADVAGILAWLDNVERQGYPDAIGAELAGRLFGCAAPVPLRFDRVPPTDEHAEVLPSRLQPARSVPHLSAPTNTPFTRPATPGTLAPAAAAPWAHRLRALLGSAARESLETSPVAQAHAALATRVRSSVSGVRRPIWIVAGAVSVALVSALILIPDATRPGDALTSPTSSVSETPLPPEQPDPVMGDDPVAALTVLLRQRERCVRDLSVLCLDEVVQPGSAAMSHDAAMIAEVQAGGEIGPESTILAPEITLVERLGDAALLSLGDVPKSQPASTLLLKGEAGWRIRGYVN
ncbi:MAG: protein kinase domain-containing protein [Microbacteriaceae bacterium]